MRRLRRFIRRAFSAQMVMLYFGIAFITLIATVLYLDNHEDYDYVVIWMGIVGTVIGVAAGSRR
jgi:hypothetical protein